MKKNKTTTNLPGQTLNQNKAKPSSVLAFLLARYLLFSWAPGRKKRPGSVVSVAVPVCGVAVGVFSFLVVTSVMAGFVGNIQKQLLQKEPHIILQANDKNKVPSPAATLFLSQLDPGLLNQLEPGILAAEPFQKADVIVRNGSHVAIGQLLGTDPAASPQEALTAQHVLLPAVLLETSLLSFLGVRPGDTVTLISPVPEDGLFGLSPVQMPVVVAGSHNQGSVFSTESRLVLATLQTANVFLQTPGALRGYKLTLKNPLLAADMAKRLNQRYHSQGLEAVPWTVSNQALLSVLALEHLGMSVLLGLIVCVGCFSIAITLLLSVRRKRYDMAILRSLGLRHSALCQLYLWQGGLIGLCGALLGFSCGLAVLFLVHHYRIPFVTEAYSRDPLPVVLVPRDMVLLFLGSIVLSVGAAVWPAREVKNLNVVDVLSLREER